MYSPTARIQLADGTELKGRRFLREYYRPRFDAGRCKTEVVQKLMLGEWVVEHVLAYDTGEPAAQLALYRVTDGLITSRVPGLLDAGGPGRRRWFERDETVIHRDAARRAEPDRDGQWSSPRPRSPA